ncbi:MAG TPA: four-helix bundle copper-binding protein [Baekduia sp.]|nr:four-helix bundle copper-binding protein [Baekduia sp.]
MHTRALLDQYPAEISVDRELLARAIEATAACAQACTACADACLSEDDVAATTRCIRDDLDCADVCQTASRVLSRHTGYDARLTRAVLQACVQACTTCADSCGEHRDHHPHCATCEDACRDCRDACLELLGQIEPATDGGGSPQAAAPQG